MGLVSVIVPAFNAERTIDRTLGSVRGQSHDLLDILVVDDGSTDGTAERVRRHAAEDRRVRLVGQANGGVAAARNTGIAQGRGELIAPIDADDLWHPHKIARQVAVMERRRDVGLVATAYSVIDHRDRITAEFGGSIPREHQFADLCRRNFIGNGSSAMMRRAAVEAAGGYDPTLRARGAQGCEDLKLYLRVAERHAIEFLRQPLTAYRRDTQSMSGDGEQMLRSFDLVAAEFCGRRPELRPLFNAHRVYMLCWLLNGALRSGSPARVARLAGHLVRTPSTALPLAVGAALLRRGRALLAREPGAGLRHGPVYPDGVAI